MSPRAPRRGIRWLAGDAAMHEALDRVLVKDGDRCEILSETPRRRVEAALLPEIAGRSAPRPIVLKTHRLVTGRHRVRERIKRVLGRSPARREWEALRALTAAGVAVPRPLAYGRLASGDELVVLERIPGRPFVEALLAGDAEEGDRARLVARLVETLARLSSSGHVHGDLQLGNLWLAANGAPDSGRALDGTVHLLDLQRARRDRSSKRAGDAASRAALRDLACLELSLLRARAPAEVRLALRAALGVGREADTALWRFAADHLRGRIRRVLRRRRGLVALRNPRYRGEREAALEEASLFEAIAAAAADPARRLRREGRSFVAEARIGGREVVIKWTEAGGALARLADRIRGSRARRAFERGRREQLLLARSARPLAWLETRGPLGLSGANALVLERVGEADLDAYHPGSEAAARALAICVADGVTALQAVGVAHADLKGSNLRIARRRSDEAKANATAAATAAAAETSEAFELWLVDLEDLALPRRPSDEARLTAWSQLNASLPDAHFPCAVREAALERALALLPFEDESLDFAGARREIVQRSRARHHRWRGPTADEETDEETDEGRDEAADEGTRRS